MKNFLTMVLPIYLFLSCKKEKIDFVTNSSKDSLTGDTAILVGTWNWLYSDHEYGWCENQQWSETLTPDTEGTSFSVQFIKSGLVQLYKDEKLIAEHRLVFRDFTTNSSTCNSGTGIRIYTYFDGIEDPGLGACIYNDTMRTGFNGFLFKSVPGCEGYSNYFIKQ